MDIRLPIKIHNKFVIEVKDIVTDEIVQRGYGENIVLNNFFTDPYILSTQDNLTAGRGIAFGSGTGTLTPGRTTLFNFEGSKVASLVDRNWKQVPDVSYSTKKIVLLPSEYVDVEITEVGRNYTGVGGQSTIFTHALIKDSEGEPLVLGPKTNTQEITIYSTIYFQPNFEDGITLAGDLTKLDRLGNGILAWLTMTSYAELGINRSYMGSPSLHINGIDTSKAFGFVTHGTGTRATLTLRLDTMENNGKIKEVSIKGKSSGTYASTIVCGNGIIVDLETLAENNSTIWSGWQFDNTPIGVGDGTTTVFNLIWDEVWLTKPYAVYVDGVEVTNGFTFNSGNITFDTAPADQAVITADYWIKYIPKDINHVLDLQFILMFEDGGPI